MMEKVLLVVTVGDVVGVLVYCLVLATVCKVVLAMPKVKDATTKLMKKLVDGLPDGDVKVVFELLLKKGL